MDNADNLVDLYLLTLVVEAGGFSAAAQRAGTTKSRLSRRIIELEERLGAQLLHRNARRFSVTAVGEQVYRHALLIREAAAAAEAAASEIKDSPGGHVRVHADSRLLPLLEGMLEGFSRQRPHTRISATQSDDGIGALLEQRADVVLCMDDALPDSADIVARALGSVRHVVVASPRLLAQADLPEHPDLIPDQHYLSHVAATPSRQQTLTSRRRPSPRFVSNNASTLLAAARAGMGYAQLPLYLCYADLQEGSLRTAFESHDPPSLPLHALTLQERAMSQAAVSFVQFARRHLALSQAPGITPVNKLD
ncbi:LysR family transcriptional regulator [Dyella caseinilytica]|uniref:LysR family transcriptional regulator n=1 Tax=Dyella caseinilytica TaxID=1849581 RepID=A0ABX7H033_9GAMM|nr:LysR family transcriptional regulator [Dyella caseinilytica]QRN55561.1 LysR family transcriptional regulator [Dyella caseinilytica]